MRRAFAIFLLLAGCAAVDAPPAGGPDIEMIPAAEAEAPATRSGLFARLLSAPAPVDAGVTATAEAEPADESGENVSTGFFARLLGPPGPGVDGAKEQPAEAEEAGAVNQARPGFFSGLIGPPVQDPEVTDAAIADLEEENTPSEAASPAVAEPRRSLFGGLFRREAAPEQTPENRSPFDLDVAVLAFGDIEPACGLAPPDLGEEVARYPETGRGYRLYDTAPGSEHLRRHYLTGFSDGCPRVFVAALALFGGPNAYETTRVSDRRNTTNVTQTDLEYRALRQRACGAPLGEPCATQRFRRLERDAVFLSLYDRFATSETWVELLLYEGRILAKDFKTVE